MNTTTNQPPHRITPENPPQFPCWVFDSKAYGGKWWHARVLFELDEDDTHWHPDQPTAPTAVPEATCAPGQPVVHIPPHYRSVTELAAAHPNLAEYIAQLERELAEAVDARITLAKQNLALIADCERLERELNAAKAAGLATAENAIKWMDEANTLRAITEGKL